MVLEVWLCQFAQSPCSAGLFELLYHSVLPFTSSSEREAMMTASLYYSVILEPLQPGSQPRYSLRLSPRLKIR